MLFGCAGESLLSTLGASEDDDVKNRSGLKFCIHGLVCSCDLCVVMSNDVERPYLLKIEGVHLQKDH